MAFHSHVSLNLWPKHLFLHLPQSALAVVPTYTFSSINFPYPLNLCGPTYVCALSLSLLHWTLKASQGKVDDPSHCSIVASCTPNPTLHNTKAAAQNDVSLELRSILYLVPPILFAPPNNINCTPTLNVYLTLFFILYKKKFGNYRFTMLQIWSLTK